MDSKPKKKKSKNFEFSVVTYFFLFLFLGLIVYFVYFMAVSKDSFINSPYNSLQDLLSEHVVRGKIISSDGYTLAETIVDDDGDETRSYPYGRVFAHVVGYSVNGKSGLENQENFDLLRSHQFFLTQIYNDLTDNKSIGDNVVTTIDYEIQERAYEALGDYDGAVIVMEPSTGKIISMVSKPDYDPNTIAQDWDDINTEGSSVLVNRATQGQYAPGSVFKMFTLLEYYRENPSAYEDYSYDCTGSITYEGETIKCSSGEVHGQVDLKESFAESCNSSFANIGLQIDNDKLNKLCQDMLFNTDLPISFDSKQSTFSLSNEDTSFLTMQTCIGQGNTLVSPLHMCMFASAVCNDGVLMTPYLVDHTENEAGVTVKTNSPKEYSTLLEEDEASFLEEYLSQVISSGTGTKLSGQSYSCYGKTGTAQISDTDGDKTNAWYVGYAKKDGYEDIAIAVIVEDSGSGSKYAIPVAKSVFDLYFNR